MDLCSQIKPYATQITKDALAGNEAAKAVIKFYRMHIACPSDPGAFGLCSAVFQEWLNERKAA